MPARILIANLFLLCLALILPAQPAASEVKSCFELSQLEGKLGGFEHKPQREFILVLDRTMSFQPDKGQKLKASVYETLTQTVQPGDELTLISFGSLKPGGYPTTEFKAVLDPQVSPEDRNTIGRKTLRFLDQCVAKQNRLVQAGFQARFEDAWSRIDPEYKSTPLLNALEYTAGEVNSDIEQHFVLLISDFMQHNKERLTFYGSGPTSYKGNDAAFNKANIAALIETTDFKNAEVYGIGIGYNQTARGGTQRLDNLETFWRAFFEKTNARVIDLAPVSLTRMPGQ